jgi:L-alanine-DL-glutamate epimerase-like enolase superfamily enzyme
MNKLKLQKTRLGCVYFQMKPSDTRIVSVEPSFSQATFRTPLKLSTGAIETITAFTVRMTVETRAGRRAEGRGLVLLSDLWAYPTPGSAITHEAKDAALRSVSEAACQLYAEATEYAHPFRTSLALEPAVAKLAETHTARHGLDAPMPVLAALMCASAVDCALHDAFGKANGICSYDGYGTEHMTDDLSTWLGAGFAGRYPADYLRNGYAAETVAWHLVGGLEKLTRTEKAPSDPVDGLPVSLDEWIERDGMYCFKIKLVGTDTARDIQRTVDVYRVARECLDRLGEPRLQLSVDANEMTPDVEHVLAYLNGLRAASPEAYEALLYVEQPTERDLAANRYDMRPVAALKPVVADEGVTDHHRCALALELGWSGVALKTCKGHASALLYAAQCAQAGGVYTVQDLTNPGIALIHSAGLAARLSPMFGVECNGRQYLPHEAVELQDAHPGLFRVRRGVLKTGGVPKLGLGL